MFIEPDPGSEGFQKEEQVPLSKHEGGLGLGLVVDGWRAADDDGGATVSPERVLQDPSHLTVSVRHVGFLKDKVSHDSLLTH